MQLMKRSRVVGLAGQLAILVAAAGVWGAATPAMAGRLPSAPSVSTAPAAPSTPSPAGRQPAAAAAAAKAPAPANPRAEADRAALVDAEHAFARMAEEKGVREAFLAFLAEDAVLFRPGPVAGREWVRAHGPAPYRLSWRPSFAEVSAAGDLGYTLGPYEVRPLPPATSPPSLPSPASAASAASASSPSSAALAPVAPAPAQPNPPVTGGAAAAGSAAGPASGAAGAAEEVDYGHFVSVWKKQPDGAWRVVLDVGTGNPPPPGAAASGSVVEHGKIAGGTAGEVNVDAARAALLDADRAFARASLAKGTRAAYLAYLADDARVLRDGLPPIAGRAAIRKAFSASQRPELVVWEPIRADVARSGDLGYTYGSSGVKADGPKGMTSDPGHYLRIWEKDAGGSWKVVLDLLKLMPPLAPPRQPAPPATPAPPGARGARPHE